MADTASNDHSEIITFLRKRDYQLVKELGNGACGRTVLLHDALIDEQFVCKKFSPYSENHREELFGHFVREIKLLHQLHHPNVVRVFNYYLYPEQFAGYILMEYVSGLDIEEHLAASPESVNELFLQAINGFEYLEKSNILHRDIRPKNILVDESGVLKIIDLGFGKRIHNSTDFEKSISLNWWCETPNDFGMARYDYTTEVYFVGKLFEKAIQQMPEATFQYADLLTQMSQRDPARRIQSFSTIAQTVKSNRFYEVSFSHIDQLRYRAFAEMLCRHISKLETGAKYYDDVSRVERELDSIYRKIMLEEVAPDSAPILNCIVDGTYYYVKAGFRVDTLRGFIGLLKSSTEEQRRVILANLHTKLDAIKRYSIPPTEEEVPF